MAEEIKNYNQLIMSWYRKAVTEDYFSKFVFLDLAFIASLRKKYFVFSERDRDAIESLKKAQKIKETYMEIMNRENELKGHLNMLIRELNKEPLKNISKNNGEIKEIKISDSNDWDNLIEFIYAVRNNLFHGEKDPESFRDSIMVYYAYHLLKPLVEVLLSYEAHWPGVEDYDLKMIQKIRQEVEEKIKNENTTNSKPN